MYYITSTLIYRQQQLELLTQLTTLHHHNAQAVVRIGLQYKYTWFHGSMQTLVKL